MYRLLQSRFFTSGLALGLSGLIVALVLLADQPGQAVVSPGWLYGLGAFGDVRLSRDGGR